MKLRLLDTFSGIGGFSLGLERTGGFETAAFCDNSEKCRHLLKHHWPEVPAYDDVCTLSGERLAADGVAVDAICGGFPCQDLSYAGKGAGLEGERSGLWREYARLVRELRPQLVYVENVSALLARGLGVVLGDLAALGYDAWWDCIPASAVGAPHRRDRLWIVAYARSLEHQGFGDAFRRAIAAELPLAFASNTGLSPWADDEAGALDPDTHGLGPYRADLHVVGGAELRDEQVGEPGPLGEDVPDANGQRLEGRGLSALRRQALPDALGSGAGSGRARARQGGWWATEPNVDRVAHGVPARVDRLHGLGNAVVPEIPYRLGRATCTALQQLSVAA